MLSSAACWAQVLDGLLQATAIERTERVAFLGKMGARVFGTDWRIRARPSDLI
jgi:hypothetical protein